MHPRSSADLGRYIEMHAIEARLISGIGETPTVEAAAAALGVDADQIVKTLLFEVGLVAGPQHVVVISFGERKIDKGLLGAHFGVGKKRVRLAPGDQVVQALGFAAGGVPPFGHASEPPALIDADLAARNPAAHVYAGGGDDQTMLGLSIAELLRTTRAHPVKLA